MVTQGGLINYQISWFKLVGAGKGSTYAGSGSGTTDLGLPVPEGVGTLLELVHSKGAEVLGKKACTLRPPR